jgi:signal transduction histidine kinase
LASDLQQSRERLVSAREEERRRLRRDLHDGLGPALAGLTLKIDAAHGELESDVDAAAALLRDLKADVQAAIADIRRLVYTLRPPALDERLSS